MLGESKCELPQPSFPCTNALCPHLKGYRVLEESVEWVPLPQLSLLDGLIHSGEPILIKEMEAAMDLQDIQRLLAQQRICPMVCFTESPCCIDSSLYPDMPKPVKEVLCILKNSDILFCNQQEMMNFRTNTDLRQPSSCGSLKTTDVFVILKQSSSGSV